MNLEEAKELFTEISDLCWSIESPRLTDLVDSILPEVDNAKCVEDVVNSAEEIQVVINDIEILPEEEEIMIEVNDKITMLFE